MGAGPSLTAPPESAKCLLLVIVYPVLWGSFGGSGRLGKLFFSRGDNLIVTTTVASRRMKSQLV